MFRLFIEMMKVFFLIANCLEIIFVNEHLSLTKINLLKFLCSIKFKFSIYLNISFSVKLK